MITSPDVDVLIRERRDVLRSRRLGHAQEPVSATERALNDLAVMRAWSWREVWNEERTRFEWWNPVTGDHWPHSLAPVDVIHSALHAHRLTHRLLDMGLGVFSLETMRIVIVSLADTSGHVATEYEQSGLVNVALARAVVRVVPPQT